MDDDELINEAIPLARTIARAYCKDFGVFHQHDEIEADALAELVTLARTWRPQTPWLKYVNRNLKFRLIDRHRQRYGRTHAVHHELRLNLNATDLDVNQETVGVDDRGFAEVDTADTFARFLRERLTPRSRLIVARRLAGYRMSEIANELGVSESRICQQLARIRPQLERALA